MGNLISWISNNWLELIAAWGGICVAVDAIAGWVNSDKLDSVWERIKAVVQSVISLNPFSKKK